MASVGAIAGGATGLFALLITYLGTHKRPQPPPIQEVRMEGIRMDTRYNSTPGMLYPGVGLEPLRRNDYELVGPATGRGCASFVAFWPLPLFYVRRQGQATLWFRYDSEKTAEQMALYEALNGLPQVDTLISPRIHVDEKSTLIWYKSDCVTLTGKGIEIKTQK